MKKKRILFLLKLVIIAFIGTASTCCFAQNSDSLSAIINNSGSNFERAKAMVELSEILYVNDLDTVLSLCNSAVNLIEQLEKKGSIGYSTLAIKATAKNNIGFCYYSFGSYSKALAYYLQALSIREKINDIDGLSESYLNIGSIYKVQNEIEKALKYYQKSLELSKKIKAQNNIAKAQNNIAVIFENNKNYSKAISYYLNCLQIYDATSNIVEKANVEYNLAVIYFNTNDYLKAEVFYSRSIISRKSINDKKGLSISYCALAYLFIEKKKYNEAELSASKAYSYSQEVKLPESIMNAAKAMYSIFSIKKKWKEALKMYEVYNVNLDILNNQENLKKTVQLQMQFDFNKKQATDSIKNFAEKKLMLNKINEEKSVRTFFIVIFILSAFFLILVFFQLRKANRQRKIIEEKEKETQLQKQLIEHKSREVQDSIEYARYIQRALLASEYLLQKNLPEFFIIFKPKDVVSGDFYWATTYKNKFILIIADCTGHGVPGAFMSLLNISKLNETINQQKITQPSLILNNVRQEIIKALNPEGSTQVSSDGMDCVLISFDFENYLMEYAAAYNSFYIIRNGQIITCHADKMPVGKSPKDEVSFTNHTEKLEKGDLIYVFTDGYADQFGGLKGKKFKYKQFEELLIANHAKPIFEQQKILENTINNWMGSLEQVDDICILAIKV